MSTTLTNEKASPPLAAAPGSETCPECGQPLRPVWHGLNACFCRWGGVQPTAEDIISHAEGTRWN